MLSSSSLRSGKRESDHALLNQEKLWTPRKYKSYWYTEKLLSKLVNNDIVTLPTWKRTRLKPTYCYWSQTIAIERKVSYFCKLCKIWQIAAKHLIVLRKAEEHSIVLSANQNRTPTFGSKQKSGRLRHFRTTTPGRDDRQGGPVGRGAAVIARSDQ